MNKTTRYLTADLHAAIKALSGRTGRSQAEIIRLALRHYVERQGAPRFVSFGVIDEAPVQSDEIEEWLREHWRPEDDWGRELEEEPAAVQASA